MSSMGPPPGAQTVYNSREENATPPTTLTTLQPAQPAIPPPNQLKHNQPGTRARYLPQRIPQQAAIQPSAPATGSPRPQFRLFERLAVRASVRSDWPPCAAGRSDPRVSDLQRRVVEVLQEAEWVLDELLGDRGGDAC